MDKQAEGELRLHKRGAEVEAGFEEAHKTLRAIRGGKGNALRVEGAEGERTLSIRNGEQPYRILLEQIQEGAATCTCEGVILFSNRRFADMLRMPLDRLVGTSLQTLAVDDNRCELTAMLTGTGGGNVNPSRKEFTIRAGDGTAVPISLSANALAIGDERFICLVATDLTGHMEIQETIETTNEKPERHVSKRTSQLPSDVEKLKGEIRARERAEKALLASEDRYRAFVTATSEVVYRMSPDWKEMRQLVGREFIPDTESPSRGWLSTYIHPDDQSHVLAAINEAIRTKSIFELEHRVLRVDGTLGWTFSRAVPLLDANGEIVEWFGTASDITKRKQAEESLRDLTQRLTYHVDHSPLGVVEWGADMRLIRWSGGAERIFGWEAEEVLGKRIEDFRWVHAEDQARVAEVSADLQRGRNSRRCSVNRNYRKDGSVVVCEWYNSSLLDESGKSRSILSLVLDVTERDRAEKALRDSEERLALALRGTQEGIWDWNAETGSVWYSPRYKEMLGYSEDEIEPHVDAWKRLLHPDDRERVLGVADAALRGEREYEIEFRLRHKDGHYVDVLSRGVLVRREASGPIVRIVGTHFDLTERKKAEEELRRTTNYLQSVIDSSPDMIISVDRGRRIVGFNRAAQTTLGYSADEVIGQPVQMLYADPEEARNVYETMQKTGQFRGEIINRAKTGATFVALLEASVLRDTGGNVLGVMGISRDITARKRAEAERAALLAATERSNEDLLAILNQLRQGIVMTDREGRITFVSQSCHSLLADRVDSACGSHWAELCPFVAEDKAALQAMAERPPDQRTKVPAHVQTAEGQRCLTEVDILDDPRDPDRKIFFIYDLTEVHDLRRLLDEKSVYHGLVGKSQAIQMIVQQIRDLATAEATVLIEGETGTGKELVAQAIHADGLRSNKLFLPVNCAGLTESLIGSQLFGHKRGAFTGAFADHRGVFETAQGGTVFLDEIGDLPLSMQTSLLRVLQEKEITRLGESTPRKVDVRVIAATHHNLDELVAEGKFRMDLLYRVRVARISIPPLRERRDDIPLLVERFVSEAARRNNKVVTSVSDEAMWRLWQYDWPGNVRELQSAIEFALLGCKGSVIQADALPPELNVPPTSHSSPPNAEEDARNRLLAAIRAAKGSRTAAARLLGVSRATFYRRLQELHLDPDSLF